jgi:uncharacterized membrane protein
MLEAVAAGFVVGRVDLGPAYKYFVIPLRYDGWWLVFCLMSSEPETTEGREDPGRRFEKLSQHEHSVLDHMRRRRPISRDIIREFEDKRTFGERLADRIAQFGGSWTFIILFGCVLLAWVITNSILLARRDEAFDPYPYILLNLFLSMLAALQAPVIMMSQNRQAAKDRLDAAHDYEVNLKAELEIVSLHAKLDALTEQKWMELMRTQEEQIRILEKLIQERSK